MQHWCGPFQGFPPVTIHFSFAPLQWGSTGRPMAAPTDSYEGFLNREVFFALIRLALAGDARATFTLWCNCHWQLLDFDSLRGAPPQRGRLRGTDCHTSVATLVRNDTLYSSVSQKRYRAVPSGLSNTGQPCTHCPPGLPAYVHRSDSMGMTCFFRLMIRGRKAVFSFGVTLKA